VLKNPLLIALLVILPSLFIMMTWFVKVQEIEVKKLTFGGYFLPTAAVLRK